MRILADVNIEIALVEWLRSQGHDVVWAAELTPSLPDNELLRLASDAGHIQLTYDKDFGELVFRHRIVSCGIVLLRFAAGTQAEHLTALRRQ